MTDITTPSTHLTPTETSLLRNLSDLIVQNQRLIAKTNTLQDNLNELKEISRTHNRITIADRERNTRLRIGVGLLQGLAAARVEVVPEEQYEDKVEELLNKLFRVLSEFEKTSEYGGYIETDNPHEVCEFIKDLPAWKPEYEELESRLETHPSDPLYFPTGVQEEPTAWGAPENVYTDVLNELNDLKEKLGEKYWETYVEPLKKDWYKKAVAHHTDSNTAYLDPSPSPDTISAAQYDFLLTGDSITPGWKPPSPNPAPNQTYGSSTETEPEPET